MGWLKTHARFGKNHTKCYWRNTAMALDFANRTGQLTFSLFLDDAAATSGAEPIDVVCISIAGEEFDAWDAECLFRQSAYEKSATADVLTGAVAV